MPTKVVPLPARATASSWTTLTSRVRQLLDLWNTTQLSHYGGKYSIERMLALEEYNKNTSLVRVVLVAISLPVAVFVVVICQEVVPLQDPKEGWQANYGFWVRVGFVGVAASCAVTSQVGLWLNVRSLSVRQSIAYHVYSGVAFVAIGVTVAAVSVFPVPFFMLAISAVLLLFLGVGLRVVLGAEAWRIMCSQRRNLRQFGKIIVLGGSICAGYPVYQVLFTTANHTSYELLVLLILPALKFIIKLVSISAAIHKEEMMPEHVVFTVNFFDILYLATFMQTISSTTITVIMGIDSVHSAMSLVSLHKRTQNISDRLREVLGSDIPPTRFDLLEAVELLCNHPQKLYSQMHPDIRVRACVPYELSAKHQDLLEIIEKHLVYSSSYQKYLVLLPSTSSFQPNVGAAWVKRNTTTSIPSPSKRWQLTHSTTVSFATKVAPKNAEGSRSGVLHEALEALFTSECLVLAEYVEFVVPLLYAAFVLTMAHLPSAQYHSEMAGVTVDNVDRAVSGILAYALLESASFVLLAVITRRNCGIRALYQLAFVLETQWSLALSKVVLWMLFTLTFRIVHFDLNDCACTFVLPRS